MKTLSSLFIILTISMGSWAQDSGSTLKDSDIIVLSEPTITKRRRPQQAEPSETPAPPPPEAAVTTPTVEAPVDPAATPPPVVAEPEVQDKVQEGIAREHDLWDPEFLLHDQETAEEKEDKNKGYLERSYLGISRRVVRLANNVDSIFGDQRAVDEYDGSTLRITQGALIAEDGFSTQDLQVSLNLQLPNLQGLEKKMRSAIDGSSNLDPYSQEEISKEFKEQNPWEFRQESGIRTRWPPSYFAQVRARKNLLTWAMVHHLLLQLGWDSETEWEQKTSVASDYAINRDLLIRYLNEANWGMTNHFFKTIHGPSLIQKIDDSSAISYDARYTTSFEGDDWYINNYTLGSTYRKAFWGRRFFFEFKPELSWPKWDSHNFNWNIYMSFELLFGRAS